MNRKIKNDAVAIFNANQFEMPTHHTTMTKLKIAKAVLLPAGMIALAGCWTPPNANVQPQGEPRLIQDGIRAESLDNPVTVQSVDAAQGAVVIKLGDGAIANCKLGPKVKNAGQISPGDRAEADLTVELAVYLLANGRLLDGTTAEKLGVNAKVLQVDPSYRLLTLQYPDGRTETVKAVLGARLVEMAPGDSVVVHPVEVAKIRVKKS